MHVDGHAGGGEHSYLYLPTKCSQLRSGYVDRKMLENSCCSAFDVYGNLTQWSSINAYPDFRLGRVHVNLQNSSFSAQSEVAESSTLLYFDSPASVGDFLVCVASAVTYIASCDLATISIEGMH